MINVADLRAEKALDQKSLAESVLLLAAAIDQVEGPVSDLCLDHLKRLREQDSCPVLTGVLDWWLFVRFGIRSGGPAFHMEDALPPELQELFEEVRDRGIDQEIPTLAGIRHIRAWTASLDAFAECLVHEHGKAGVQAAVRQQIGERYEPVLDALRAGAVPDSPNLGVADIRRIMTNETMQPGSDLWRKTLREWEELDECCEAALKLASRKEHGFRGADVGRVDVELVFDEPVNRALRLLLRDVLDVTVDDRSLVSDLVDKARCVDEGEEGWLSLALEGFVDANPGSCKRLNSTFSRIRKLRKQVKKLETTGLDVELVEVHLSVGDLVAAGALVAELSQRRVNSDRAQTLRSKVNELRDVARRVGNDDVLTEIEYAEADLEDDQVDEADRRVGEIGRLLHGELLEWRRTRYDALREELSSLATIGGGDVDGLFVHTDGASSELTDDDIAHLEDLLDQSREEVRARVRSTVARLQDQLDRDGGIIEDSVGQELTVLLDRAEQSLESGQLVAAAGAARDAARRLDRSIETLWTAEIGETPLIEHIHRYVHDHMQFNETDVDRLFVGLKTKPFVILSGLTGSGKTTIARLFAEAVGATPANRRFVRIAVRPNWVDEAEVLGYINPMSNRFEPGWLATLARDCRRQPDLPFYCLLDEMNLAPVEYYLADYLSAVEDANSGSESATMALYSPGAAPTNSAEWPPSIPLPDNLFLLGTVNVDESTRPLSDRVLDRANVIQLSTTIGTRHHHRRDDREDEPRWKVRMRDWRAICASEPTDDHHEFLVDVAGVLNDEMRLGLGIRAHIEMERFLANSSTILNEKDALDVALLQRVIPKLRGFKRDLLPGLERLLDLFSSVGADRCVAVIADWLGDSTSDEAFLDGSHARVGLVTSSLS